MAPKKSADTTTSESISTMSGEERLRIIVTEAVKNVRRGVPVLVGPTQWGKTKFYTDLYVSWGIAPENIVMMNPQNDLPEDIGGWPRREGDYLYFTQPANIPPRLIDPKNYDERGHPKVKWGIIVDELDKAREETLSAMLTFFNPDERRLRTTRIPVTVPIVAAMNELEGRMIPDPLLARLLFLPYPAHGMDLLTRGDLQRVEVVVKELFATLPTVKFPKRPKAPGSLHKLVEWIGTDIFWKDEAARKMIIRGLFSEQDAVVVAAKMQEQMPKIGVDWAQSVSPTDMLKDIITVLSSSTFDDNVKILHTLVERAKPENDPTGEMERLLVLLLETPEALHAVGKGREKYQATGVAALMKKLKEAKPADGKSDKK